MFLGCDAMDALDPEPLLSLCLRHVAGNLALLAPEAVLPSELSDRLVEAYQRHVGAVDDGVADVFRDRSLPLRTLRLRDAAVSDSGLEALLAHDLEELHLHGCRNLTSRGLDAISYHMTRMRSLTITDARQHMPSFNPNQLRRLVLRETRGREPIIPLRISLYTFTRLVRLELSGYRLTRLRPLPDFQSELTSLSLYNVSIADKAFEQLHQLRRLRHLDISQHSDRYGTFSAPDETLAKLIRALPRLTSLDISGTNLAGTGAARSDGVSCDIPGLSSRVGDPLRFLGLYGTAHAACRRHHIPAKIIAGHANEEQILTAATLYLERPHVISMVLNDMFHRLKQEQLNSSKALAIVFKAMDFHTTQKHIQIRASGILSYIVKNKSETIGVRLRRQIIRTLLESMETHLDDPITVTNGCLTLCQFKIPDDVMFDYERVASILLNFLAGGSQEDFVQCIATLLLNSLACQVDACWKEFLGDRGVIWIMLSLISDRLERKVCDDVLEVAWSIMWNVTDETSINCKRFYFGNGLELFLGCLKNFPSRATLLKNMMGLLGNVAEVQALRPLFTTHLFIKEILLLLDSNIDGIEVSYNAAGVLAHIASDGEAVWTITDPSRRTVLDKMAETIEKWNIRSNRTINYRSFEPLVSLLKAYHTPECQHWAVWALANLTTVYPERYCSLVKTESVIQLLNEILASQAPYPRIKILAKSVLDNCHNHFSKQTTMEERESLNH